MYGKIDARVVDAYFSAFGLIFVFMIISDFWPFGLLQSSLIEITFRHGCSPVNLLHIFRTLFSKNTSGWMHLKENFF